MLYASENEALREALRSVARDAFGCRSDITDIRRTRSLASTSYNTYLIHVRFSTGNEFRFFLKDFGSSQLPKDDIAHRRERELRVYRDLLPHAQLGTARYYGCVWDGSAARFWLILELVNGTPVKCSTIEYWLAAAGWLARLHGHFAERTLNAGEHLIAHDPRFFRSRAEQAREQVAHIGRPWAGRLGQILGRYDGLVERMTRQPSTLLHGSYRSYNILVDTEVQPLRVCPIDWEGAAFGAPLFDLAYLADGFGPAETDRLLAAYHQTALAQGIPLPGHAELRRDLYCFRLHMALDRLGRAKLKGHTEEAIAELLDNL